MGRRCECAAIVSQYSNYFQRTIGQVVPYASASVVVMFELDPLSSIACRVVYCYKNFKKWVLSRVASPVALFLWSAELAGVVGRLYTHHYVVTNYCASLIPS